MYIKRTESQRKEIDSDSLFIHTKKELVDQVRKIQWQDGSFL
jgi:hypothetical protein